MKDKDCGCICHRQKLAGPDSSGLIHDTYCCSRMNGSLMIWGVEELLQSNRQEAYNEAIEDSVKMISREESFTNTYGWAQIIVNFSNLKK